MKKLLIILAALTAFMGAALVVFYMNLGGIVTKIVNQYGPEVTGTEVTLADSSFSLFDRQASLSGLVVNNPTGFRKGRAFALDKVAVKLGEGLTDANSPLTISEIVINGLELHWDGIDGENIQKISENASNYSGSSSSTENNPGSTADKPNKDSSEKRPVLIETVKINNTGLVWHYKLDVAAIVNSTLATVDQVDISKIENYADVVSEKQKDLSTLLEKKSDSIIEKSLLILKKYKISSTTDSGKILQKELKLAADKFTKELMKEQQTIHDAVQKATTTAVDLKKSSSSTLKESLLNNLGDIENFDIPIKIQSLTLIDIEATEPALAVKAVLKQLKEQISSNLKGNEDQYKVVIDKKKKQLQEQLKPALKKAGDDLARELEKGKTEIQQSHKDSADRCRAAFITFQKDTEACIQKFKDSSTDELKSLEDEFKKDPEKAIDKARDILKGFF